MKKKYLKPDLEVIALETCVTTLVGFSKTTEGNPPNNKVDAKEHNAESGSLWDDILEDDDTDEDLYMF
ncbi:MAG: hypothetical protein U0K26_02785 [Prevotella pectinovora]|uniref:hypothetical protein n=1 Tax=Prevotella pectinovora TaxID=1602169 RepID=UPI002E76D5B3|nr:hypothetical protein [Prevotella pectinovora]MEE1546168.1 hypothetical protein [Prevotella pectinovora]